MTSVTAVGDKRSSISPEITSQTLDSVESEHEDKKSKEVSVQINQGDSSYDTPQPYQSQENVSQAPAGNVLNMDLHQDDSETVKSKPETTKKHQGRREGKGKKKVRFITLEEFETRKTQKYACIPDEVNRWCLRTDGNPYEDLHTAKTVTSVTTVGDKRSSNSSEMTSQTLDSVEGEHEDSKEDSVQINQGNSSYDTPEPCQSQENVSQAAAGNVLNMDPHHDNSETIKSKPETTKEQQQKQQQQQQQGRKKGKKLKKKKKFVSLDEFEARKGDATSLKVPIEKTRTSKGQGSGKSNKSEAGNLSHQEKPIPQTGANPTAV